MDDPDPAPDPRDGGDEPRDPAEPEGGVEPEGDVLPEDLDVTAYVGPYQFPDIRRRRIAGTLHLVGAIGCGVVAIEWSHGGMVVAAAVLGIIAAYHFACAWPLRVDQTDALAAATRTVGFPIGHASAQLGFRGLRSRPSWRILLYSADSPPSLRGLVEIDAVDGDVIGEYTEENPEDWSEYGYGMSGGVGDEPSGDPDR